MPERLPRDHRATWNLVTDESRATAIAYGVRAIPQTFFIAPDGRISQRYFAAPSEATFDAEIEKILPPSPRAATADSTIE